MMRKAVPYLLAAALIVTCMPAHAQDEVAYAPTIEVKAYAEADAAVFFRSPPQTGNSVTADGVAGIEISGPLPDDFEMAVKPEFRWSAGSGTTGEKVRFIDDGRQRPLFTFAEAWIAKQAGPVRIKAGKQIRAWGSSDLFSPSDDLNAYDQLDPPEAYKIGEPMLVVTYSERDFAVEALVMPWFTPDRLPARDNPWARSTSRIADAVEESTGRRPEILLGERQLPDAFEPAQFGGRITSSALVPGTDVFFSGFRGISRVPVLLPRLDTIRFIYLDFEYPAYAEFAAGFSTVLGSFELHGEAAWHLTDKHDREDDYVAFVLGARRDFAVANTGALSNVRVILEYAGEAITRHKAENSEYITTPFDRPIPNSLLGQVTLDFGDDTSFSAGTIVNLDDGDYAFDSGLRHRIGEGLIAKAGLRLFGGPRDTYFGEWRSNDQVYASIAWTP
ncbi:MAG: hypothetical protein KDE55_10610 [Novosphingobium sp.]|nr:hypothetical protein [Novosphingobium sp.]